MIVVFAADPCIAHRIVLHELWCDEASLAAHFKHPNYLRMRDALGAARLVAADTAKYRVDLAGPVYDATRTPRADFFTANASTKGW